VSAAQCSRVPGDEEQITVGCVAAGTEDCGALCSVCCVSALGGGSSAGLVAAPKEESVCVRPTAGTARVMNSAVAARITRCERHTRSLNADGMPGHVK